MSSSWSRHRREIRTQLRAYQPVSTLVKVALRPEEVVVTIPSILLSMDSVVTLIASVGWYRRYGKAGQDKYSVHRSTVGRGETIASTRQVAEVREPKTRYGPNCFT